MSAPAVRLRRWRKPSPSELEIPQDDADPSLLGEALQDIPQSPEALIPALQAAQGAYGYLPRSVLARVAEHVHVPWARAYGVVTFYAQFSLTPRGKHIIRACRGTACHVGGSANIIEAVERTLGIRDGETTEDRLFTLETVACLGTCSLAPVMLIGNTYYGRLRPTRIPGILNGYRSGPGTEDQAPTDAGPRGSQ